MPRKEAATPLGKRSSSAASDTESPAHAGTSDEAPAEVDDPLLIVGIGASAGGLEAFRSFFGAMPPDSGMAFVLVQHLAPNHTSLLTELIARATAMEVSEACDGDRVEANHVYVIPPDATLTIEDGVLQVTRPAPPREHRWPINTFFASLAEDRGDCAVCVVLSGTGSDGARGLRAVKEHGGLTLAQSSLDQAAMTGMPASAVATGLVDHILPVEEMPARLLAHRQQLHATGAYKGPNGERQDMAGHLRTICQLLRAEVGHDFSQYKDKTLARRIQRRMHVVRAETVPDYIEHLRGHPEEHQLLFREFLIGVTEFFRDPKAFEALQATAIPQLLAAKGVEDTLRVWVSGCATGEEAYSIAIALKEGMARLGVAPKVQIFATDIDDHAIAAARAGRYKSPLTGVSEERRARWFIQEGDDWRVVKDIREMCVFSPHSAIKDPPFSRMDLVSCRNLLIYLNTDLQERMIRTFHYALRPEGFLLLGPSESLGRNGKLFEVVSKTHRLYMRGKNSGVGAPALSDHVRSRPPAALRGRPAGSLAKASELIDAGVRQVLERYSPAYVVIDSNDDIVRFAGDTGRYLEPVTGAASLNLYALLHRGLRVAARAAVRQALAGDGPVVLESLSITLGERQQRLRLIASPLPGEGGKRLCMLAFDALEASGSTAATTDGGKDGAPDQRDSDGAAIQRLERELASTRAELQAAMEQQETANEELKSSNEEFQSVNEEFQSANEELETSKEEMQSINEELQVVNAEMHSKNATLAHLNSDLQNLLDSTQIATLFLDSQLRVSNFTPAMTDVFHLRESDRERPIHEIAARIDYPDLQRDVAQVLRTLAVVERQLSANDRGVVFMLRMRPYRTVDHMIDGVVLTFVDITERQQQAFECARLAAIIESSREIIIGHTLDGAITSWNASAERVLGYPAAQMMGKSLTLLLPVSERGRASELLATCSHLHAKQGANQELEMPWQRQDGSQVPVAVNCAPVVDREGKIVAGSLIARDNSERMRAAEHVKLMLGELNHRVKNTLASVQAIALQTMAHSSSTLEEFREAFMARLLALSSTHNLLADDAWNGVGLRQVVHAELAPYDHDGDTRVTLTGETLMLNPKAALALSMALHELATNASKYGALSVPRGQVDVLWTTRTVDGEPWLRLLWTESGGPKVAPPTRRGFGSRLIRDGLPFELDGTVALEFEPGGVVCRVDVPMAEVVAAP